MLTELLSAFSLQQSYRGGVKGKTIACSCRSIMPRQDELAFMKAISTLQVSPALLKDLRKAMARRKKNPAVPARRRSTTPGSGTRASQQLTGKRKPAPSAGSVPLPANSTVAGEQAAAGSRQPGPSGGGATYAAVLVGTAVPSQRSGPLKPTAMD